MEAPSSKPDNTDAIEMIIKAVKRSPSAALLFLRLSAIITTLVAIILMANSKRAEIPDHETDLPYMPDIFIQGIAKWQYFSPLVFFMVSNIIACVYATISLVVTLANSAGSKGLTLLLFVLELVIVALLCSANGAATDFYITGNNGISRLQWYKFCDMFGYTCRLMKDSIVVSMVGSVIFFLVIVLTLVNLYRRCL
ncbi:hypothetical protein IFM89_006598 [Coptis chinensis]|uniref:CASP-like protein n=1 Tax=Coptis chinensis TaxID=261450 RepID=A0A835IK52_9MAGN|nr:hypothetical protein IFM89_006598 [Coptis chinensis]